jgi:hypothetical protein
VEGFLVEPWLRRFRVAELDKQGRDPPAGYPAQERKQSKQTELAALAGHGKLATEQGQLDRIAAGFRAQQQQRRFAHHAQVAHQALEAGAQRGTRHHGVADHVEVGDTGAARLRDTEHGVAGALHRQIPQPAHLLGGIAHFRIGQL